MIHHIEYLSLWEIAHRWYNLNPNNSSSEQLAIEIQDILRFLAKSISNEELPIITRLSLSTINHKMLKEAKDSGDDNLLSNVIKMYEKSVMRINAVDSGELDKLEETYIFSKYDPELLSSIYIERMTLLNFCLTNEVAPPKFWYTNKELEKTPKQIDSELKIRNETIDRNRCEALAQYIWEQDPKMTITAMCKHPAILKLGNGTQWKPRTIRKWVTHLDPRSKADKTGRPVKQDTSK